MEAATEHVSLPWRWILEHLVDMKDIGPPILKEMMTYIPNLAHLRTLHKRTALRYLEEAIAASKIDAQVIPLVAVLLKESQQTSNFPASSDYKALLVRVQVEAVIAHIRGKQNDWQGFSRAIHHFFPENALDSHLLHKRAELLTLLEEPSRERKYKEILQMYSLTDLRWDLLKCVSAEKARLGHTFLDKLLQDVFNGTYPVSAAFISKPASEKKESQEDFHSADGQKNSTDSDDQTIVGGRNSNAESEEANEAHLKDSLVPHSARNDSMNQRTRETNSTHILSETHRETKKMRFEYLELRRRDQHGKAIKSTTPMKATWEKGMQETSSKLNDNENTAPSAAAGYSLHVEFLNVGSDGHEEVCHKCKEGGRLLCCDGCPIAFHRKCLGYDPKSYTLEDWFCPLCAQKQAAEAVAKAKLEDLAARKRVLQFIASEVGEREKQPCSTKRTSEQSIGRKLKDKMKCGDGQQDHARISNKKASSPLKDTPEQVSASCKLSTSIDPSEAWVDVSSKNRANEKQCPSTTKRTSEQSIGRKFVNKTIVGDGEQYHTRKSTLNRQTTSNGTSKQDLAFHKRSTTLNSYEVWVDVSSEGGRPGTEGTDMALNQDGQRRKATEELKNQSAVHDGRMANFGKLSAETRRTIDEGHAILASSSKAGPTNEAGSSKEQVNIEGQAGVGDGHDGDLEEDSESRRPDSLKPKKDRRLYFRGNRIIPGMRRKRLQWTKEEEDALKEGVKRFSHDNGSWGFQWTRILEFGHGKFHPSRTDVDLKDKWRNLFNMLK